MSNESVAGKKFSRFEQSAFIVLSIGLFLLPLFFVPSQFILFEFAKMTATIGVVALPALLILCARLKDGQMTLSKSPLMWSLWSIPFVYLLSALFSAHTTTSLVGYGFEIGTFGVILILVVLASLVSYLFRSASRSFSVLLATMFVALLIGLFHIARFVFGATFLSFGLFTDITYNTFGKWYDLSLLFGFTAITATALIEQVSLSRLVRFGSYVLVAVSLAMLVAVNFFMAWVVVAVCALVIAGYTFLYPAKNTTDSGAEVTKPSRKIAPVALVVFLVSLFFIFDSYALFTEKPIAQRIAEKLTISQVEVRPSWISTGEVIMATLKTDPFFGVGPNRFASVWTLHKPEGINAWPFWNVDFSYGIGFIPTAVVTTGILGTIAWVAFLVFLLLSMGKLLKKTINDRSRGLVLTVVMGTIFFWFFAVVYVPSTLILVLTFVITGLFLATLHREGILKGVPVVVAGRSKTASLVTVAIVVAFIATITLGYVYAQKALASYYFRVGVAAFGANDPVATEANLVKAFRVGKNDLYLRSLSDFYLAQVNVLLNTDVADMKPEDVRTRFETLFRFANTAANQAVAYDPTNYQNYLTRARVYEIVVPLKIENAYESAKSDYISALQLNPQNPLIFLLAGRLEAVKGNIALAKETVQQALALKPDYEDAKTLLAEIAKIKPQQVAPIVDKEVVSDIIDENKTTTKKK